MSTAGQPSSPWTLCGNCDGFDGSTSTAHLLNGPSWTLNLTAGANTISPDSLAVLPKGLLAEGKEMNTSEIAKAAGRSVSRVSNILAALRLAEVVRYQTEGTRAQYRLKHPRETRKILAALSGFVKSASPTRR